MQIVRWQQKADLHRFCMYSQEFLQGAGLESYVDQFASHGVYSVDDIRAQSLDSDEERLKLMGLKTVQTARLREALRRIPSVEVLVRVQSSNSSSSFEFCRCSSSSRQLRMNRTSFVILSNHSFMYSICCRSRRDEDYCIFISSRMVTAIKRNVARHNGRRHIQRILVELV
jgi:hypothetical protein